MISWLYAKGFNYVLTRRLESACSRIIPRLPAPCPSDASLHPNLIIIRGLLEHWHALGQQAFKRVGNRFQWLAVVNFILIALLLVSRFMPYSFETGAILSGVIMVPITYQVLGSILALQSTALDTIEQETPSKTISYHMLALCAQVGVFQLGLTASIGFPIAGAMSFTLFMSLPLALFVQAVLFPNLVDSVSKEPLNSEQLSQFLQKTESYYDESGLEEIFMMEMDGATFTTAKLLGLQRQAN